MSPGVSWFPDQPRLSRCECVVGKRTARGMECDLSHTAGYVPRDVNLAGLSGCSKDVNMFNASDPDPPEGFADFVGATSPRLLRAAWLLTGDAGLAEDLLQTAFARAWPHWRRIRSEGNPEAYIRRILFTTHATWWRRKWRGEVPVEAVPEQLARADESDTVVSRTVMRAALASLSQRQRAIVILRFMDDQSEAETAAILGCSVGAVKSQTSRALTRLRAHNELRAAVFDQEVAA
jgi:RNA polymerase sigma-70 factor (sigma-E family)